MKLFDVLSIHDFCTSIQNAKMPIKTTYKLARLMNRIEMEAQFYQSQFTKILQEYAQIENGQYVYSDDMTSIKIVEGKEEECTNKIYELRNLEIDLSDFSFDIEEFENLNLSLAELNSILPLIKT